jgi:CheY-like chemotaxis protein
MRRNREVNELLLRLRMRDALLTDEALAALPIALTVHLPCAFWSPAVVEITGRVPTADLRDDVVRLAKRELARWRTGAQTAARLVVDPLIGPRVAAGTRGAASAVTPRGMGPHVLIADDDRSSLNGLEVLLTRWGCRVETATDGQMALEKTLALHPSLVITDFTMPRLNGLEVWEVLRRDCPEIPVIILTGQGAVEPLLPAPEEGPYGYLEKPVEVPQLRMLVAKALAPKPGTVSSRASRGLGRPTRNHPRARRPFPSGRCGGCPSVVLVPSGPAVPLPQGANKWRSSPEGGLR